MRNSHKVLIVVPAHACLLLPERIFPYNDRAHSLFYQKVDNALTGGVQVVVYLTVPLVGNLLHLPGDTLSVLFGKAQLELFHALIIPLIHGFQRSTVNQSRDKALSVCCYRRYVRDAKINGYTETGVYVRLNRFFAVNHFYDVMAVTRNYAALIDLLGDVVSL